MAILLHAAPPLAGLGLRRADFERRLVEWSTVIPLGAIYFQRISRAVDALEARGALVGKGDGRKRSFVASPEGFASLLLNLQLDGPDPALDPGDFELKREVIAALNLSFKSLMSISAGAEWSAEMKAFFDSLDRVTVLGHPVVTEEVLASALDLPAFLARHRSREQSILAQLNNELEQLRGAIDMLRLNGLSTEDSAALERELPGIAAEPAVRELLVAFVTNTAAPELSLQVRIKRAEAFIGYLDAVSQLYAAFQPLNLQVLRGGADPATARHVRPSPPRAGRSGDSVPRKTNRLSRRKEVS